MGTPEGDPVIRLVNLTVHAGAFSISDVNLEIPSGQYGVLMGRTGCGKTTILEAICGLKRVTVGAIELMNNDVTHLRPGERGLGFVPQDVALFETMTVRDHLAFGPFVHKWPGAEIEATVATLANELGVAGLLDRKPHGLSGGERQRVALGRALALRPHTLLLDEPLSALDEETREEMQGLLKSVQDHFHVTTLHVTHSHHEAARLADCLFQIRNGKIEAPGGSRG